MENLYKVKKSLMNGLEELDTVKGGKLKMGELEAIKLITSALDHIGNICEREEEGGSSMAGDYSAARRHRDSMGRYSRNGEYSHADAKREMMGHLANAYAAAPDDEHRRMARDLMDRVDRA